MTQRLEQVQARLGSVRQLEGIVGAMRNMASTRVRQAKAALPGIAGYAAAIGAAIGSALAFEEAEPGEPSAGGGDQKIVFVFGSEQGFVGGLNDLLIGAARANGGAIVSVGRRLHEVALEHNVPVMAYFPMPAQPVAAPALAMELADWLFARAEAGRARDVRCIFPASNLAGHARAEIRRILPFDYARFGHAVPHQRSPLSNVPPAQLLPQLAAEYIFAELCDAIIRTSLAENEVRVAAMTAARDNISDTEAELERLARALQQEIITSEVIELSAGAQAAANPAARTAHIQENFS